MSADATGNFILTGEQTPSLRKKLVRAFSPPLTPSFGRTGDNALPLTAFALAFSPVSPLSENDGKTTGNRLRLTRFLPVNLVFVVASLLLRCLFPAHVREKTISLAYDGKTTGNRLRLFCFLPVNLVFVAAFAALKVSLWRHMSADATIFFILTVALCASDKQHPAP